MNSSFGARRSIPMVALANCVHSAVQFSMDIRLRLERYHGTINQTISTKFEQARPKLTIIIHVSDGINIWDFGLQHCIENLLLSFQSVDTGDDVESPVCRPLRPLPTQGSMRKCSHFTEDAFRRVTAKNFIDHPRTGNFRGTKDQGMFALRKCHDDYDL